MATDINLVNTGTHSVEKSGRVKKLRAISFSALFIVAILGVILFLISLKLSANSVKKQADLTTQKISSYDSVGARIFVLNSRLDDISSLLNNRKKYNDTAGEIIKIVPSSVSLEDLSVNDAGITMTLNASSLLDLNNFLNSLIKYSSSKKINSISLEDLSTQIGGYQMKVKAKN